MGQSNVGIRLTVDAGQAKGQVEDLSRTIADLNKQLKEASEAKDWKSMAMLSQSIDNLSSGRSTLMQQHNQAVAQQQQAQTNGGIFGGSGMWVLQQSLNQITHGILSAWDAALTAAKQRASGDYTGAAVTQKRATGEAWGQGIGSAVGALGFLLGPQFGMMTTALVGEIGKFLGGIDAKKMEENLAYSAQYKSALQGIDTLNQLYGGAINRKDADENDRYGMEMRGRAAEAARGTGLDTDDFIRALKESGGYGIRSETQAMNMLQTQALWSRFTGADLSAIQKYAGQAYRYNGETNAMATAYGGLMAQNMGKGQITEFLNLVERAMTDGISKGYVKSTAEIAGNMALMYKLSGGSALWQGEQGAQRYSQMSNAISNAANLQSVEDVISYGAARDLLGEDNPLTEFDEREKKFQDLTGKGNVYTGSYADVMQLLERGLSADLLKGQWSAVRQLDGDNPAAMIERFKTMYGLNYTGASQVWAMSRNSANWTDADWEKAEKDIKRFQETPQYQSDSQKLQDILNDLRQKGILIGNVEFLRTELPALNKAMIDLAEALRIRTEGNTPNLANIAEANEILNEVWNPPSGGGGYAGIPGNRATQTFLTLEDILYHADNAVSRRRDPGAYEIGNRLQGLMPSIRENPSDEVLRLVDDLATKYYEFKDDGIDASEKHRLDETLNSIETVLRNLVSVLPNIQNPIPLNIKFIEEMG